MYCTALDCSIFVARGGGGATVLRYDCVIAGFRGCMQHAPCSMDFAAATQPPKGLQVALSPATCRQARRVQMKFVLTSVGAALMEHLHNTTVCRPLAKEPHFILQPARVAA